MGLSGQRHAPAPAALYPGEMTPGTHCTEGCTEPVWTKGLEENPSARGGDRTPFVQPVVRHYTAYATAAPHVFKWNVNFNGF
jgi:hypothetical protein